MTDFDRNLIIALRVLDDLHRRQVLNDQQASVYFASIVGTAIQGLKILNMVARSAGDSASAETKKFDAVVRVLKSI